VYVPILAYHKINNRFEWGINTVPIPAFERQVKYLSEHNFYSATLDQYVNNDFEIDSNRRPIIITFDDADESVYHHAFPILKAYEFTATIFVISDFVGRANTWDANLGGVYSRHLSWEHIIELLNAGWEIGSHTATHRDLSGISEAEAMKELGSSRELIEQKVSSPIRFISYPFNRFNDKIISFAKQVGYIGGCALSKNNRLNGSPGKFNIPRHGVYSIDTLYWFKKKLSNSKVEQLKQRMISSASFGTILYRRYKK